MTEYGKSGAGKVSAGALSRSRQVGEKGAGEAGSGDVVGAALGGKAGVARAGRQGAAPLTAGATSGLEVGGDLAAGSGFPARLDATTTELVPAEFPVTRAALETLRTKLNAAYADATARQAVDAEDAADRTLTHVEVMLVELDREAAAARDGAMQAATADVAGPLAKLEALKGEIDGVNRDVQVFGDVLDAADKVISLWKSCFSM